MTGLFDEGAGDLDSEAFQIRLDDAGAEMSFDAGRDAIYGSMRMLAEQKDEAFDLLRLAVNEPRFDQAPIDRIRAQIAVRHHRRRARSRHGGAEQMGARSMATIPIRGPTRAPRQSSPRSPPDDLRAFHKAVFARGNLHVAVVGAIDAETLKTEAGQAVRRPAGKADARAGRRCRRRSWRSRSRSTTTCRRPRCSLPIPASKRDEPDFFAAVLMNQILGGGTFTSRLFEEVREKRGLAYGVNSSLVN